MVLLQSSSSTLPAGMAGQAHVPDETEIPPSNLSPVQR
jgi:hypothetical protein